MEKVQTAVFDPEDGKPPYRRGVLLVLVNSYGEVFAGQRTDMPTDGKPWQLPQGGIKAFHMGPVLRREETVEEAALRELREEVGKRVRAAVIAVGTRPIAFEFDRDGNDKYRGQMLTPVLLRYQGGRIDISQIEEGDSKPAFSKYGWFTPEEIRANATKVKLPVYDQALTIFRTAMAAAGPHVPDQRPTGTHGLGNNPQ